MTASGPDCVKTPLNDMILLQITGGAAAGHGAGDGIGQPGVVQAAQGVGGAMVGVSDRHPVVRLLCKARLVAVVPHG